MNRWVLLLAEGLGSGRLRPGPGTWGSLVGVAWLALLLAPGRADVFLLGTLLGIAAAIPVCTRAEQLLGRHDPGSVVLDEIVAIPLCAAVPLAARTHAAGGHFPDLAGFLGASPWWFLPLLFLLFRVFDIAKPWPIRAVQALPRGWGVVADDLLAAAWVGILLLLVPARA